MIEEGEETEGAILLKEKKEIHEVERVRNVKRERGGERLKKACVGEAARLLKEDYQYVK